ncbi:MAG: glycosyltransferase [Clostridiales bacterium]|nr:MAG: glycosyltransferase [Clostridiales bacterium]
MPSILIVDMGTDDETAHIVQKLCDEYGFIYYTTQEKNMKV